MFTKAESAFAAGKTFWSNALLLASRRREYSLNCAEVARPDEEISNALFEELANWQHQLNHSPEAMRELRK
jgi:hypothetical protein